jgi:formylglycine-generating enzyme required for sulfatase activity
LYDNGNGLKPVGQKQPNAFGLYDMLANGLQWTADWYCEKYYQVSEKEDPSGPAGGPNVRLRVLLGGSWVIYPRVVSDLSQETDSLIRLPSGGLTAGRRHYLPQI